MEEQPNRTLWLQNNDTPRRQQNQMRPGPDGGGPNGTMPPRRSNLNRWLLVIVLLMLALFLYSYFNPVNSNSSTQRDELSYSDFYNQISLHNIKDANIIGSTDITGDFNHSVNGFTQYHVVQLPNGDQNLTKTLIAEGAVVNVQNPPDNSFWINILILVVPWVVIIGLFIFMTRRAGQGQQGIFSFG